jgi:peptidoglycan/LPS O-acetylase OafA/YrhL
VGTGSEDRDVVVQSGERRVASIESLRALAAIGVLVGHIVLRYRPDGQGIPDYLYQVLIGGGFGVVLFFCLTGYLLFWPFVQQHYLSSSQVPLRRYALNRVLRILPLYYVAIVLLIILRDPQGISHVWLKHLLLLQNFFRDSVGSEQIDGVLWSVIVEMHFYLLLPLLAWGVATLTRRSLAWTSAVLGVMAAVSLGLWLHYWQGEHDLLWRWNLPATFFFFTGGMQLALLRAAFTHRRPAALDGWARHGDLYLLVGLAGFLLVCADYSWVALLALTSPFLLAPFVLGLQHAVVEAAGAHGRRLVLDLRLARARAEPVRLAEPDRHRPRAGARRDRGDRQLPPHRVAVPAAAEAVDAVASDGRAGRAQRARPARRKPRRCGAFVSGP